MDFLKLFEFKNIIKMKLKFNTVIGEQNYLKAHLVCSIYVL